MAVKTAIKNKSTKNVSTRTKKKQARSSGGQFGTTAQMPPKKAAGWRRQRAR